MIDRSFTFPHKTTNVINADARVVMGLAIADLRKQMAILINLEVFIENPAFILSIHDFYKHFENLITKELAQENGIKLYLSVPNADDDEDAMERATRLYNNYPAFHDPDGLKYFEDILAERSSRTVCGKIAGEGYCKIGVVIGPRFWIDSYLRLPQLHDTLIGVVTDVKPYSVDTIPHIGTGLNAAAVATLTATGQVPPNIAAELGIRQEGQLIWPNVLNPDDEYLEFHKKVKGLMIKTYYSKI